MKYSLEELEAIRRYKEGEKLQFSTGICETLTYGYGVLSIHGYWQYPMPYNCMNQKDKDIIDSLIKEFFGK